METLHPAAIHMPLALVLLWPIIDGLGLKIGSPHLMRLGLGLLVAAALATPGRARTRSRSRPSTRRATPT